METLGPADAIFLPLFAGLALGALYLLIKWLEDPAILSVILNVYFSLFGVVATAKLAADAMGVLLDFVFPDSFRLGRTVWTVLPRQRCVELLPDGQRQERVPYSPLPGLLGLLPLPWLMREGLWRLRELPRRKAHVRVYVHNILTATIKIGPLAVLSAIFAVCMALFTNFISTPWYLNNLSAFAFVYSALQVMTPSTAWTATLILGGLFVYDIYFVFYTPLMVTVATKLDIPAKMLFPRPEGMSMLGLGDLAVPGMVIGFALRFDLWNFYYKQQISRLKREENGELNRLTIKAASIRRSEELEMENPDIIKPQYHKATGRWGTRFWTASLGKMPQQDLLLGRQFPKPYFYATIAGYVLGMLCTLLIMQVYGHAQPALLYLVPGVLGGLWGTALAKGEVGILWQFYDEANHEDQDKKAKAPNKADKDEPKEKERGWWRSVFHDLFVEARSKAKESNKQTRGVNGAPKKQAASTLMSEKGTSLRPLKKPAPGAWHANQLFHFSISFPFSSSSSIPSAKSTSQSSPHAKKEHGQLNGASSTEPEDSGEIDGDEELSAAAKDEMEGSDDEASRLLDVLEGKASD